MNFKRTLEIEVNCENKTVFKDSVIEKELNKKELLKLVQEEDTVISVESNILKEGQTMIDLCLENVFVNEKGVLEIDITAEM
jgi:hypothetical protein